MLNSRAWEQQESCLVQSTQCRSLGSIYACSCWCPRDNGAARKSHNEHTRNALKHSTYSHKWWEILKGSIIDVSSLFLLSVGPEVVWWWLLLRKFHSWAFSFTISSVVSCSSHLCLFSLSLGAILWPLGLLSFFVCFLILTHMVVLILWVHFLYF